MEQYIKKLIIGPIHIPLFYLFLLFFPLQTRILFHVEQAYVQWYFNYHLAFFLYLSDLILVTCFMCWLMFDRPRNSDFSQNRLFFLLGSFLLLCLTSLFHVKRIGLGIYETLRWVEIWGIVLYITIIFRETWKYCFTAVILAISGLLQAIMSLLQFHVQHSLGLRYLGEYIAPFGSSGLATIQVGVAKLIRAYGTMPHPNVLGAFLVLGIICGLFMVARGTAKTNLFVRGLCVFLMFLGLFVTFSRVAWLGSVFIALAFAWHFWYSKNKSALLALILIVIVSCGTVGLWFHQGLSARITDSFSSRSITDRYLFNKEGWDLATHFPMLGVGVGNYVPALQEIYPDQQPWQYQPPHNIFIFVAAELGFLGLGLLLMILYEIFSSLKNVPLNIYSFTFTLAGIIFLLMGQFDHYFVTIQQGRLMFAVVFGLIAALPNLKFEHDT